MRPVMMDLAYLSLKCMIASSAHICFAFEICRLLLAGYLAMMGWEVELVRGDSDIV